MKDPIIDFILGNNENHICNYCGQPITTQGLIGALCYNCNIIFFEYVENYFGNKEFETYNQEKLFIKFVKDKVSPKFVFR
jgi:hypothetical protein